MDKRYNKEYWTKLERNQRCWKEEPIREQEIIETIKVEEKEIGQKESKLRKWNEKDNKMENICDLYYELQKSSE